MPGSAVQVRPQLPISAPGRPHRWPGAFILGSLSATLGPWPTDTHHQTDVVIVGAGPVGLFAVFECGMLRLHCHVVDVLDDAGGQCTALYPEKPIYDIPGYPAHRGGRAGGASCEAQAAPFQPVYHLGEQVQALEPAERRLLARRRTSKGTVHRRPRP